MPLKFAVGRRTSNRLIVFTLSSSLLAPFPFFGEEYPRPLNPAWPYDTAQISNHYVGLTNPNNDSLENHSAVPSDLFHSSEEDNFLSREGQSNPDGKSNSEDNAVIFVDNSDVPMDVTGFIIETSYKMRSSEIDAAISQSLSEFPVSEMATIELAEELWAVNVGEALSDDKLEEITSSLQRDPRISLVEPDFPVAQFTSPLITRDVGSNLWNLDRISQRSLPLDGRFSVSSKQGLGVRVYVVDDGIRLSHEEFESRAELGFELSDSPGCSNDHGTHVAGTIAGKNVGVAGKATIVSIRVFPNCSDGATSSDLIAGLDAILEDHQNRGFPPAVANLSLGLVRKVNGVQTGATSTILDDKVRSLVNQGIVVVVASGNLNEDACLGSPARVAEAITVNASTVSDGKASYSNFGSCADIYAPGGDLGGPGILSAIAGIGSSYQNNLYAEASGTSMAAPHVAGVASLILSENPNLAPDRVRTLINDNATSVNFMPDSATDTKKFVFASLPLLTADSRPSIVADSFRTLRTLPAQWSVPSVNNSFSWERNGEVVGSGAGEIISLSCGDVSSVIVAETTGQLEGYIDTRLRSAPVRPHEVDGFSHGCPFIPISPARLLDSRQGFRTVDMGEKFTGVGRFRGGTVFDLEVIGRGGIPLSGVSAVALNVTVTEPTGDGWITVFPKGQPRPNASNLNFVRGQTIPNMVVAKVGAGGEVSFFVSPGPEVHLIVDVAGWFSDDG